MTATAIPASLFAPTGARGVVSNLVTSVAPGGSTISVSFDQVSLWDGANAWIASGFSNTVNPGDHNTGIHGPLGIDTGAITNGTWYYIWVMAHTDGTNITTFISTSGTVAGITYTNLTGYSSACPARIIGMVTVASGVLQSYYQFGTHVWWQSPTAVVTSSTQTTFRAVSNASYYSSNPAYVIPPNAVEVVLSCAALCATAGGNSAIYLGVDGTHAMTYLTSSICSSASYATVATADLTVPIVGSSLFYFYQTGGYCTIAVRGFTLNL